MSREEVIRTVGGPPGNYSNGRYVSMIEGRGWWWYETWLADDGNELLVIFDDEGVATYVEIRLGSYSPSTVIDQIRLRLGL